MATRPLTLRQQRAAALIGRGRSHRDSATEVGVEPRTITRWAGRDDFRALVRQHREATVAEVPSAKATLEAALTATAASGAPDWKVRVSAARALVGLDGPGEAEARETTIYTEHLDRADAP